MTGKPRTGEWRFSRKVSNHEAKAILLHEGEELTPKHRVFDRTYLPNPWEYVSLLIQKFITYEGHFGIILN